MRARQLRGYIILSFKGFGRPQARARPSTAAWLGNGAARVAAGEPATAPGPVLWHARPAAQQFGQPKRQCMSCMSSMACSGAAVAGCIPRRSTRAKRAGRDARCPACRGTGMLGRKARPVCNLSLAKSAATAGGARHRLWLRWRRRPLLTSSLFAPRAPRNPQWRQAIVAGTGRCPLTWLAVARSPACSGRLAA